jgi:hypothetical protein
MKHGLNKYRIKTGKGKNYSTDGQLSQRTVILGLPDAN